MVATARTNQLNPRCALFDNNAWADVVVRDGTNQQLMRVQQSVAQGYLQIPVTTALLEETVAYAATCPTEVRRRIAYMRSLGHMLRPLQEIIEMEIRGEPTRGRLFLAPSEESDLYDMVLPIIDSGGQFISPEDGQASQAAAIVYEAKLKNQYAFRHIEEGADQEIFGIWERDLAAQLAETCSTNELGVSADAAPDIVLQAWGKRMVRQGRHYLRSWVMEFLSSKRAAKSVVEAPLEDHPFSSAHVAYVYAHAARHFMNGKLTEKNDFYDRQYCVLSMAANTLVTSDKGLRSTCELMPFRPFEVLAPMEFVATLDR